ncbi:unnamed protein product [Ectocarpus sp. 12 AP-2014]
MNNEHMLSSTRVCMHMSKSARRSVTNHHHTYFPPPPSHHHRSSSSYLYPEKDAKKAETTTTTTHSPVGFPGSTPYDHRPALTPNASSHKQSYTGTSAARPIVASLSLLSLLCVSYQSLGSNVLLPPPSHLCFVPRHDE